MKLRNTRRGFTLIELLVVVLIIGILAAVAVPQYKLAVLKSRASQAFVRVKAIQEAEQVYYLANGDFTNALAELDVDFSDCQLAEGKENTNYICADGMNLDIHNSEQAQSVYAYVNTGGEERLAIEYRFETGKHVCIITEGFSLGEKVCQSLGGVLFLQGTNAYFYWLP